MERGKRASMREGPLAALFRKTEEEGIGEHGADDKGSPQPARERAERSEFGQTPEPRVGKPTPSRSPTATRDSRS